jgi:exodeoxyribonuclease-3
MKLISWNVNGIRAIEKKGNFDEILQLGADIVCFQETKAEVSQLSQKLLEPERFSPEFYSSTERKGHAGVAIYSKSVPRETVKGGLREEYIFDFAGRVISNYYDITVNGTRETLVVVNCYFPNGADRAHHKTGEGLEYKLGFYKTMHAEINVARETYKYVIVCGDYNVAHTEIDLARPKENKNSIGFLPIKREWMDELLADNWVDTFRHFYPQETEKYTWWDTISRSRDRNVGWRIDYIVVSRETLPYLQSAEILSDIFGSDHCPTAITFSF